MRARAGTAEINVQNINLRRQIGDRDIVAGVLMTNVGAQDAVIRYAIGILLLAALFYPEMGMAPRTTG
jgi:hypothetical protein